MQRKKELIIIIGIAIVCFAFWIFLLIPKETSEDVVQHSDCPAGITLDVKGEIVRPARLIYANPISYAVLFYRLKNNLNEYSDISQFPLDELITSSRTIIIPTYDTGNSFTSSEEVIEINSASLEELKKLPQIGEKRAQKILDYIQKNGLIQSWEIFFDIVGVPEHAKDQIQQQAVL